MSQPFPTAMVFYPFQTTRQVIIAPQPLIQVLEWDRSYNAMPWGVGTSCKSQLSTKSNQNNKYVLSHGPGQVRKHQLPSKPLPYSFGLAPSPEGCNKTTPHAKTIMYYIRNLP